MTLAEELLVSSKPGWLKISMLFTTTSLSSLPKSPEGKC